MNRYLYIATCKTCRQFSTYPVVATNEEEALLIGRQFEDFSSCESRIDGVLEWDTVESGLFCDCCENLFDLSPQSVTRSRTQEGWEGLIDEGLDPDGPFRFCSEGCEIKFRARINERRSVSVDGSEAAGIAGGDQDA